MLRKAFAACVSAVCIACFVVSGAVFAEDKNYFEYNLNKMSSFDDFGSVGFQAYRWLFDGVSGRGYFTYDQLDDGGIENDYLADGTHIMAIRFYDDGTNSITLDEQLTYRNNVTIDFTDEDKAVIDSGYDDLRDYDGIILRVAEDPEPDCDSVCVVAVKNSVLPDGAHEKSKPIFDGLDIGLDLYFPDVNVPIQYKVTVVNNTDVDLQIAVNDDDENVGYDVEMEDSNLPAKSRKELFVNVYIREGVADDAFDAYHMLSSKLVIDIFNKDPEDGSNPGTFGGSLPIALAIISGLAFVALIRHKNGRKIAVFVALLGFSLVVPTANTSASVKYELVINTSVEILKMSTLTLSPNAPDAVATEETIRIVGPEDWVVLHGGIFYRQGYIIDSWNSEPDGSGDDYYNEDSEYQFDHDVTLYAIWDPAIYVSLTDDEGYLTVSDQPFGDYDWYNGPYYENYLIYMEKTINRPGRWLNPFIRGISSHGCDSDTLNQVHDVKIMGNVAPKNLNYFFMYTGCWNSGANTTNRFRMDLSGLDVSQAYTARSMFSDVGSAKHGTFSDWSIGDLSDWNVSNITNMGDMFSNAGNDATSWTVGDLSGWNVSNVTDMSGMFSTVGYSASSIELGSIKNWNISNVEDMSRMFSRYGYNYLQICSLDLNGWNTLSLTNTSEMFKDMCYKSNSFSLDLSSFNMSNVTNMSNMFNGSGNNATSWNVIIPKTNGNGLANTSTRMYGANESIYVDAPAGRSFTLAD